MNPETLNQSLDNISLNGDSRESQTNSNAISRRSISIFSRRGTETPEPKPPFIAQAAMRSKPMTEKQKKWLKRKSCPASTAPKKQKGTIINAVPPAKTIRMTRLEEEMATSPNEEILSAINGTPRAESVFVWPSNSTEQVVSSLDKSSGSSTERAKSWRRDDRNSRIGVWRDGIIHWDRDQNGSEEPCLQHTTGFSPLRPTPSNGVSRSWKPTLSVVIPKTEPLINDTTISTILQPTPQRPVVSVAPASLVSKYAPQPPTIVIDEPRDLVSPLTATSMTPPPESQSAPVYTDMAEGVAARATGLSKSRSSSASSLSEPSDISVDSYRSSATSVEEQAANVASKQAQRKSSISSVISPATESEDNGNAYFNLNKPLPPTPIPPPSRAAPLPPPSTENRPIRQLSLHSAPGEVKREVAWPLQQKVSSYSLSRLDLVEGDFLVAVPGTFDDSGRSTPTLSQAEDDLEAHLSSLSINETAISESHYSGDESANETDNDAAGQSSRISKSGSVRRNGSVRSVMQPPERAPTIPKRSRKREWHRFRKSQRATHLSVRTARRRKSMTNLNQPTTEVNEDVPSVRRSVSAANLSAVREFGMTLLDPALLPLPPSPEPFVDDGLVVLQGPVRMESYGLDLPVSANAAEDVLLHILAALDNTDDLFNTALINKGMYRVFKENEMDLIRRVSYNQSPPAWEFREWCLPENDDNGESVKDYTPFSYVRAHQRDSALIDSLKRLLLERCQTTMRRETVHALSSPKHPHAQRFDDAFWRIFCFCRIFGSGKGREADITGQLDWLKGGLLAHNQEFSATMNMNLDFDMSSVLLNPPEFFAKCNDGGLSAQQLYDMTEIWTCLTTLLEGYHGRTEQAWENSIYDQAGIGHGDDETEEQLLEEWTAYLLTLGPRVVLEMAEFANDSSSAGFALAKVNGWTNWSPPEDSSSRSTFLKEPVSRLYEERVTAAASKFHSPLEKERKEMSRKRVANLAAEIKLARQSSTFKRLPYINMSMERPMSVMSRRSSTRSTHSVSSQSSVISSSMPRQSSIASKRSTTPIQIPRVPNFSVPNPKSPQANLWSPRKISPIIEDRVETFNRLSLQQFGSGVAEDTADRAVQTIVDMGFSASQARDALRTTDMGDGIRVDRAVDMLLRQRGWGI